MHTFLMKQRAWLWPLLLMALLTPFTPYIDLTLTRHFFYNSTPPAFHSSPFDTFMYNYGLLPGQLLFVGSGILLFLSCFFKKWKSYYASALILVLTLAIGSGLIIHGIFKDHWGRPRPKQVIEFSGTQPFRAYYTPNLFHQPEPSKSFSCGHCSMGFYFFALALIGYHYNKRWLWIGSLTFALILGIMLSYVRIVQGGHFFSDTVTSALIMWLTAYFCYILVMKDERIN